MPWRPSTDQSITRTSSTKLWEIVRSLFHMTIGKDSLTRGDYDELSSLYVRQRKGDHRDPGITREKTPASLQNLDLGETDADLIEFILTPDRNRVLNLEGPRGAGKTSTVHFVESALRKTGYDHTLLILDGLGLSTQQDASPSDFITLLHAEAAARSEIAPAKLTPILNSIVAATRPRKKGFDVNAVVAQIAKALNSLTDKRLLTIVFDNLDHLPPSFSVVAADLAKILYVRTGGLGAIMCLREGSSTALYKTSSARAFFGHYQRIHPPKVPVWIRTIGRRMRESAEKSNIKIASHPTCGPLTPLDIENIFNRFATLLSADRPGDTVLKMLDAMSADDTRHLILLIQRILMHRTLPEQFLITGKGTPDFHPVPALIEGADHIYRSHEESIIPNLLWFSWGKGDAELLLAHHLLALLDTTPSRTNDVINWLKEFNYSEETIVACLKYLAGAPILIKLTDCEVWDDSPPAAIYLTEAGYYYRNHFLRFTDYLALVVTDVPLDHKAFRRSPTSDLFTPRLLSLLEYAEEVRRRENLQINELGKRPPSAELRRVAASLDRGGLLTAALIDGLQQGIERGRHSKSAEVRDLGNKLEPRVYKLQAWLHTAEERLREVMNRGRKDRDRVTYLDSERITTKDGTIDFAVKLLGDSVRVDAVMRSDTPIDAAFVAIRNRPEHEQSFGQATLLTAPPPVSGLQRFALSGQFGEVRAEQMPPIHALQFDSISLGTNSRRRGLLSVTESSGSILNITLHNFDRHGRMVELGGHANARELEERSADWLADISKRLSQGKPFSERIYEIGVTLAETVLSATGRNELAAYLPQIENLIIFSTWLKIPWEWMVPRSLDDSRPTASIGDACRVTRWPWHPVDGVVRVLNAQETPSPLFPLSTFGLPPTKEWRRPAPKGMSDLANTAANSATLHLVGSFKDEEGALDFGAGWELDALAVNGTPLRGPHRMVVSGCNATATEKLASLVVKLSAVSNVAVWAPLVKIREAEANVVDDALAVHSGSVDDFMKWRGDPEPLTRLYVRYGLPT
jgi:hypothetical protein